MRDKEFLQAMNKMAPILTKKFHFLAKQAKVRDDRKSFVEDLVSLTILESLLNSRKEIHAHISCEQLIRVKAKNVWAEYWKKRNSSFNHANHEEIELDWKEERVATDSQNSNEKIDWLLENSDKKSTEIIKRRLENYEVNEIAKMQGTSAGSITMQIQRLKNKLKRRL